MVDASYSMPRVYYVAKPKVAFRSEGCVKIVAFRSAKVAEILVNAERYFRGAKGD